MTTPQYMFPSDLDVVRTVTDIPAYRACAQRLLDWMNDRKQARLALGIAHPRHHSGLFKSGYDMSTMPVDELMRVRDALTSRGFEHLAARLTDEAIMEGALAENKEY